MFFPNYRYYLSNIFNVSVSSQLSSPEDKGAIQCLHVVQSLSGSGSRLHLTLFTPCFRQSSPSLTKYSLTFSILSLKIMVLKILLASQILEHKKKPVYLFSVKQRFSKE